MFEGAPGAESSFVHSGVKQGVSYRYGAFAYDAARRFSGPRYSQAAIGIDTLPSFSVLPMEGAIRLEWTNPAQSDFDATVIRYSTGAFPKTVAEGRPVPNGNDGIFPAGAGASLTFDHTGLASDSVYKYSAFVRLAEPERYSPAVYAAALPIAPADTLAPDLAIAVFQNPYLTQYLDIFVIGSEPLDSASVRLAVGGSPIQVVCNDPDHNVWKGDYTLTDSIAVAEIVAEASDLSGNQGRGETQFSGALVRARSGGALASPDGRLVLRIEAGSLRRDQYVLLVPAARNWVTAALEYGPGFLPQGAVVMSGADHPAFLISPPGMVLEAPCHLQWSYSQDDVPAGVPPDRFYLDLQGVGPLESFIDPEARMITAAASRFGLVRLTSGLPGSSRVADPDFLEIDPARPNPFAQSTSLGCEIRSEQMLRIDVYDVAGRHVVTLLDRRAFPGSQYVTWTGRTPKGDPVGAGVYLVRAQTEHRAAVLKVIRAR
jgi:hypothetical protein